MLDQPIQTALQRFQELGAQILKTPELPAPLKRELEQVFYALRNHVFFLDYQKRRLDELRAQLDRV